MDKIKIVFVVTFVKNVGVYNVVSNIASNINYKKYDVSIISCINDNDQGEIERLKKMNIHYYCLNYKNKLQALFFGKMKIKKILNEINPQIIHSHAILADSIVSSLGKKYQKISTIHCNLKEDYEHHYGKIKSSFILKFHLNRLKKFDEIIGCSKSVKNSLNNYFPKSKYVVNCLNTSKFSNIRYDKLNIRDKLNIGHNDYVYIYVGSLSERKNVIELVNKFNMYSNVNEHLILIGDGPLYEECLSLAKENIHILGYVNEPSNYLLASDIYISFSKSEGMALSVIEAMSCGLYLFLSDIESHSEIFEMVNEEYIGELFNSENFHIQLMKIRKLYKKDDKKKMMLIKERKFNIESMIKGYCEIYEESVKK